MNTIVRGLPASLEKRRGGVFETWCRSMILEKLKIISQGRLEIADRGEVFSFGEESPSDGLRCRVTVLNPRFYARNIFGGSTGTGQSYRDGDFDCDDLTALVRIFLANRPALEKLDGGWGGMFRPLEKIGHILKRNSISRAKDNIHAHYDLGNDFFGLFLDDTWMYSCAIFSKTDSTLTEASREKNDRICRKLELRSKDHLLEIGTGWGGFAIHAAENYGCRVTTTTISQAQYALARERVKRAGLADRVEVLLRDYRELSGRFDKLVSIEMVEAVGLNYLNTYFKKCGSLLKPDGSMCLQSIIIQDQYYEAAKKSVDFIQKHIFPGSGIPSVSSLVGAAAGNTDLRLFHQEDITTHYARTLSAWSRNLKERREEMLALGYPLSLYRLWQFYFAYCEGGFLERTIGTVQMVFTKPACKKEPLLGSL